MNIKIVPKPVGGGRRKLTYDDIWERLKRADATGKALEIEGMALEERRAVRNAIEGYIRQERLPSKVHVKGFGKDDAILLIWLERIPAQPLSTTSPDAWPSGPLGQASPPGAVGYFNLATYKNEDLR